VNTQYAIIKKLELPVRVLSHSGKKSLHAIIDINAKDMPEYKKRVDYLYAVCNTNGLSVDKANCNPSRLSRFPGFDRDGKRQYIIHTNIGKASFDEWFDYIQDVQDDLPDIISADDLLDYLPDKAPELIHSVLRQGHKMMISAASKAGKSFMLIDLAVCIAEGRSFLGWQCTQGKVLYVNLEIDEPSYAHRLNDKYVTQNITRTRNMIDVWNLRGNSKPLDQLASKLTRRCEKRNYVAVIIDPLYKVMTGDENSAEHMGLLCNQFDKISKQLGVSVIYAHHHSKGTQGAKRSADRASGSGVLTRDPDAAIDMIELEITPEMREQIINKDFAKAFADAFPSMYQKLKYENPDATTSKKQLIETVTDQCGDYCLDSPQLEALKDVDKATLELSERKTAWRIEPSALREFAAFKPKKIFFEYPNHVPDTAGILADAVAYGEEKDKKKSRYKQRAERKKSQQELGAQFHDAVNNANMGGSPTVQEVMNYLGMSKSTIHSRMKTHGYSTKEGRLVKIK
jgi:RecA-family ATPase